MPSMPWSPHFPPPHHPAPPPAHLLQHHSQADNSAEHRPQCIHLDQLSHKCGEGGRGGHVLTGKEIGCL